MWAVFLGGALGSILRAMFSVIIPTWQAGFPIDTLAINWMGSAGIALVSTLPTHRISAFYRRFWMTGFFGGFTTMSIFSYESLQLLQKGEWLLYLSYILLTILGSTVIVKLILKRGAETA